jgi:uncharacterized protein YbjT (DUF2867 family)
MKLLILGATGRTGRAVLDRATAEGHHVEAFGRRPAEGAAAFHVGAFGDETFREAVRRADAVLSCLASSNADPVCSRAAEAVRAADPQARYVTVAGAAVDRPEDRKGFADALIGGAMRLVAGKMLADRQREVEMLAASAMRWTALRPPRLTQGKPTGAWRFDFDRPQASWIDREDLAGAMLEALGREDMVGAAPFVSAR